MAGIWSRLHLIKRSRARDATARVEAVPVARSWNTAHRKIPVPERERGGQLRAKFTEGRLVILVLPVRRTFSAKRMG